MLLRWRTGGRLARLGGQATYVYKYADFICMAKLQPLLLNSRLGCLFSALQVITISLHFSEGHLLLWMVPSLLRGHNFPFFQQCWHHQVLDFVRKQCHRD